MMPSQMQIGNSTVTVRGADNGRTIVADAAYIYHRCGTDNGGTIGDSPHYISQETSFTKYLFGEGGE